MGAVDFYNKISEKDTGNLVFHPSAFTRLCPWL